MSSCFSKIHTRVCEIYKMSCSSAHLLYYRPSMLLHVDLNLVGDHIPPQTAELHVIFHSRSLYIVHCSFALLVHQSERAVRDEESLWGALCRIRCPPDYKQAHRFDAYKYRLKSRDVKSNCSFMYCINASFIIVSFV